MASFFYCLEILIVYLLVEASLFKYRLLITVFIVACVIGYDTVDCVGGCVAEDI